MGKLVDIITSGESEVRDQSIGGFCRNASPEELELECDQLELFRNQNHNLYEKVRALFFLYYIHRFALPFLPQASRKALIPYKAYKHIMNRRFEEGIEILRSVQKAHGLNQGICSALADAYRKLGFQTLTDQVKMSVRNTVGNSWMFRIGHPLDQPLRLRKELVTPDPLTAIYPILKETTPVRMDLSHSCWSDIFFLGMDFPEGARVLNISVDLCIAGAGETPVPPVEACLRVIDEPVIRLVSTDLEAVSVIRKISDVFNFADDYLGLLKAAVIASGIIPPGMEGLDMPVASLLERMVGQGLGLELVSQVNNIPKGSRLAVSTTLLASLISVCMRATGQTLQLTGILNEEERRLVASKAILGEWLGGSGGGWQDSGGVWPGIKLIKGVKARPGDPEYGISKGKLLPDHEILDFEEVSPETRRKLQDSLVMVHGGMAQNVGPILEMVTEKYLLRSEKEWKARKQAMTIFDAIVEQLKAGNIRELGAFTQSNFDGPVQDIIPSVSNAYTGKIIEATRDAFKEQFWGFWMMGGMSGGGMGFIFDPSVRDQAREWLLTTMLATKKEMEKSVPFAMDPVVYDFKINEKGTSATFYTGEKAFLPVKYYTLMVPNLLKKEITELTHCQQRELELLGKSNKSRGFYQSFVTDLFDRMIPQEETGSQNQQQLTELLKETGFNPKIHEEIKAELKAGRIGLAQNRLPVNTLISDPLPGEVLNSDGSHRRTAISSGNTAIRSGEVAIVTLAGGIGSRWTQGAGVVKALHPFFRFAGRHRNFIEVHLAKNRRVEKQFETSIPHVFTTSYMTHQPVVDFLKAGNFRLGKEVFLSPGKFTGLRLYPMERDLRFYWDEMPHQILDDQAQKVRDNLRNVLVKWTKQAIEGEDYTENKPEQCIHPVGHWFEIPNMILNGTLKELIRHNPGLRYLLVHNIDTLGVTVDPALLGLHIKENNTMTVEVIPRWMEDRGGGLARVNDTLRLVEGMALPDESVEFRLSYYNTNTFWITIEPLLAAFGLTMQDLDREEILQEQILEMSKAMPSYITIKDVKKRWGKGQEDIFPVTQFEKLWGDMTALPGLKIGFVEVSRFRGQQLKEMAQLDGWVNDGSAEFVNGLCHWNTF
ncbi:MAG: UTP--glucose-1-phosphate uridylyltransferase [Prolixibacteraceae bacterium]|nr:UTP--glucose-1-phosphate uridylyltransferase [Prolixibacteraceae bacterium]